MHSTVNYNSFLAVTYIMFQKPKFKSYKITDQSESIDFYYNIKVL